MELTTKEEDLIRTIRNYKELRKQNLLFTDYILYLRGILEELIEEDE